MLKQQRRICITPGTAGKFISVVLYANVPLTVCNSAKRRGSAYMVRLRRLARWRLTVQLCSAAED